MLEKISASNIVEKENLFNYEKGIRQGIPAEKFEVELLNFDEMDKGEETYDLIVANDCFLHSSNKTVLMTRIAKMLSKGGLLLFTDILEDPQACREMLTGIYNRLHLSSLGTALAYERDLSAGGLTKK
mmetsp:Transcript_2552/g.4281  ORF Transcript_2552/g.4281 Transcript_2552/m.4281 type:complete len:128 (+) Transcript_2552:348-731(+)